MVEVAWIYDVTKKKGKVHRETLFNRFRPKTIVFGERTKQTVVRPLVLQALKSSVAHAHSIPVRSERKENTNKYLFISKCAHTQHTNIHIYKISFSLI